MTFEIGIEEYFFLFIELNFNSALTTLIMFMKEGEKPHT